MTIVQKQSLQKVKHSMVYRDCTFYLEKRIRSLKNSKFFNCSFRSKTIVIQIVTDCVFENCNFAGIHIDILESTFFKGGYINCLEISPRRRDLGELDFLDGVKIFELSLSGRNIFHQCDTNKGSLRYISPKIGRLDYLVHLNLQDNKIKNVPPEIENLTALTSLNLEGNKIEKLPMEIGSLTALTSLNLKLNDIGELPPEIGNLIALTSLNLEHNQIRELPPEIGNLTALTSLNLEQNQTRELPPEIGNLTALTSLNLKFNRLSHLPLQMEYLTSLTSLNLQFNQLSEVPRQLKTIASLTSLVLRDNDTLKLSKQDVHYLMNLDPEYKGQMQMPLKMKKITTVMSLYFALLFMLQVIFVGYEYKMIPELKINPSFQDEEEIVSNVENIELQIPMIFTWYFSGNFRDMYPYFLDYEDIVGDMVDEYCKKENIELTSLGSHERDVYKKILEQLNISYGWEKRQFKIDIAALNAGKVPLIIRAFLNSEELQVSKINKNKSWLITCADKVYFVEISDDCFYVNEKIPLQEKLDKYQQSVERYLEDADYSVLFLSIASCFTIILLLLAWSEFYVYRCLFFSIVVNVLVIVLYNEFCRIEFLYFIYSLSIMLIVSIALFISTCLGLDAFGSPSSNRKFGISYK